MSGGGWSQEEDEWSATIACPITYQYFICTQNIDTCDILSLAHTYTPTHMHACTHVHTHRHACMHTRAGTGKTRNEEMRNGK